VKSVPLFDAKNRFSELCETVARSGEPCLVTRRGKPLVQVIPVAGGPNHPRASVWDTLAEGETRYGPLEEEIELPDRAAPNNRPSPLV
jgi:prevent-host-death family protein